MAVADFDILTFDGFLTLWAKDRPDWPALSQDDHAFTYGGLEEHTAKIASMLMAMGLKKGDRIAWIGKNSDLYFSLFYGAARVGIVMVPIGWRLAPAEWAYIAKDTGARVLFAGQGFDAGVQALAEDIPGVEHVIAEDDAHTKWDDDEVVLIAMPCAHIGGTGLGIMALASGLPGLVQAEFSPDAVFDAIEKGGATRLFIVPAALQMMVNHPRCRSVDYSRLKYILYGAAPIPLELLRQSMDVFNAQFIQVYGMTETTGTICMLPPEDHDPNGNKRMRSAGKPLPGVDLRIVDGAGNDMPVGEVGEVWTRSSNNMIGYWNLPDATKGTVADGGWIKTGDAGYLDEDGYLYIHDRVKDMIITGGENVYPAEVESAIYGHPDVLEVAVIGVPDAKWGEAVKAVSSKPCRATHRARFCARIYAHLIGRDMTGR